MTVFDVIETMYNQATKDSVIKDGVEIDYSANTFSAEEMATESEAAYAYGYAEALVHVKSVMDMANNDMEITPEMVADLVVHGVAFQIREKDSDE